MLSRENRLTKKEDFRNVYRRGRGTKGSFLYVKSKETNERNVRVGFVVGKTVSLKASVRNQVKRRMRAAMGGYVSEIKESADIIIIASSGARDKTFSEIRDELEKILKKRALL